MKEAINLICEKIGIVIDWGADNVWPQIIDALGRYRIYEIVVNSLLCLLILAIVAAYIIFCRKLHTDKINIIQHHNERKNLPLKETIENSIKYSSIYWNVYDDCDNYIEISTLGVVITIVGGCAAAVLSVILMFCVIPEILKWAITPEIQYLELIKSLM